MVNKLPTINLFKKNQKSFIDKFFQWSLTIGRIVVIATELIALTAFLYRFSLDRQLVDLHETIKSNQNIVNLLKKDEEKYRNLQNRLTISTKLSEKATKTYTTFQDFLQLIPTEFVISSITLSDKTISIRTNAKDVATLASFIRALRESPFVGAISLDQIENRTSSGTITVGLTVITKDAPIKKQ